jgi:SAM-dependent methyltransferase
VLERVAKRVRNTIPVDRRRGHAYEVLRSSYRLFCRLSWRFNRVRRPAWLGTVRRTAPLSDIWGHDRGTPVDRYYIEQFLARRREDIRGRVLEIKDNGYTKRYGAGVDRSDVLDIDPSNPAATIVTDLAAADAIPSDSFDCVILTQTLQYIYDVHNAVTHLHRILRSGGVLLATVPGISRIDNLAPGLSDYWRFTAAGCTTVFGHVFDTGHLTVRPYGNVFTAIAFLTGIAQEELSPRDLDVHDDRFPVIIAVRAVKRDGFVR